MAVKKTRCPHGYVNLRDCLKCIHPPAIHKGVDSFIMFADSDGELHKISYRRMNQLLELERETKRRDRLVGEP
jgi:hypothetical protein